MKTWTVTAQTARGTRSIIGTADTIAGARRAALRCAHTHNGSDENPFTRYEIRIDHQLMAIVTANDDSPAGRAATQHLLDCFDRAVDPYAY